MAHPDGSRPGESGPRITVIMPVLNGMELLPRSIGALEASDLDPQAWSLLVVDDGSTDGTADWVRARGHQVVATEGGPLGPGAARNVGARHASGDVLAFVDADVCAHPDALRRFAELFDTQPDVGAAFGAYDTRPTAPGFISQYRNLYHRYVHLRGAGDAETFWAGCGAVRRDVFAEVGGFDIERFPRPQIEDIELGYRIRDAGWRIVLDPRIQGTHMKRWTLSGMLRTDLFDRGVPWMRLLLAEPRPNSLNVGIADRLRVAGVGLACLLIVAALVLWNGVAALTALAVLGAVTVSNPPLFRWYARERGFLFALGVVPFHILFHFVSGCSVALAILGHVASGVTPARAGRTFENSVEPAPDRPDDGLFLSSREPR